MTQKELLYLEDAISHEKNLIIILQNSIDNLKTEELTDFMAQEVTVHQQILKKLCKLLEDEANE